MARTNVLCGSFLRALGVISLLEALRIRDDWLGAKLMPAAIALALLVLGASHCLTSVVGPEADRPTAPEVPRWRRSAFVFGALALFVAALPRIGFLPATAVFLLALVRLLGVFSWARAIAFSGAIAIASHVVFRLWLGMPLPRGPFGF